MFALWRAVRWLILIVILSVVLPAPLVAQEVDGFDGYIQSGPCQSPTDALRVPIDGRGGEAAVVPYRVDRDGDADPVAAYYGNRSVPGFGILTILSKNPYSIVITAHDGPTIVACGDVHLPASAQFIDAGPVLVRLDAVDGSGISGIAILHGNAGEGLETTATIEIILVTAESDAGPAGAATPVA